MKYLAVFLFTSVSFCQNIYHNIDNRVLFADHLFCTKDYIRAAGEYRDILSNEHNDLAQFKLALSLSAMGKYNESEEVLSAIKKESAFYGFVLTERIKNFIADKRFADINLLYSSSDKEHDPSSWKLRNFSYLYMDRDSLPSPPYIFIPFDEREKNDVSLFYDRKINLPQKDPLLAGFLSALIPGLGKVYTEEYGDAFFAALVTGISGYLAYTNFKADHTFRGVLFTGIGAWFYGSNIYGAAASAGIFNAKVNFSFTSLLDSYLRINNYFTEDYRFCR